MHRDQAAFLQRALDLDRGVGKLRMGFFHALPERLRVAAEIRIVMTKARRDEALVGRAYAASGRRTQECSCDVLAASWSFHSMILSARSNAGCGIVRPMARAVFK